MTPSSRIRQTFDLSSVTNPTDSIEFGLAGASLPGSFMYLVAHLY
jgi:hypothetical protein